MVSIRRNRATREEEIGKTTIRGHEKKGESVKEVYQKQNTFKPYTNFSLKKKNNHRLGQPKEEF